MSFSNTEGRGFPTGVMGRNQAATWAQRIEDLRDTCARLRCVTLECDDAIAVIKRWDSPQTLFYCDPPYPGANQGHYAGYTAENFAALVATLATAQGSFVLSNYEQPGIPAEWARHEIDAYSSAAPSGTGMGQRTEILWIVDRSHNARPDLQDLLWSPANGYATQNKQSAMSFDG